MKKGLLPVKQIISLRVDSHWKEYIILLCFVTKKEYSKLTFKVPPCPGQNQTGDPSISSRALYHVAIKASLNRKAVQVYHMPTLYPVTFSPSILNSSSNSQEYKNHWKGNLRSSNAHVGHLHWAPFVMDSYKNLHAPAEDRTEDPSISGRALYHVAIKAGLYRKAVQVYHIPNLYHVTYPK